MSSQTDRGEVRLFSIWPVLIILGLTAVSVSVYYTADPSIEQFKNSFWGAFDGLRYTGTGIFAGCGMWLGFLHRDFQNRLQNDEVISQARQNLFRVLLEVFVAAAVVLIAVTLGSPLAAFINESSLIHKTIVVGLVSFFSCVEVLALVILTVPVSQLWQDVRAQSRLNQNDQSFNADFPPEVK